MGRKTNLSGKERDDGRLQWSGGDQDVSWFASGAMVLSFRRKPRNAPTAAAEVEGSKLFR
jgi:hypothetical protein